MGVLAKLYASLKSKLEAQSNPSWGIQFGWECLPNCMWGQIRDSWAQRQHKFRGYG